MKNNYPWLAVCLLLAFGGAIQTVHASPVLLCANPNGQELSPAEIERLREKAAQTRARVRQERERAIEAQRETDRQLAAALRPSNLRTQDWKDLFRSLLTSRKTIGAFIEKRPLSLMELESASGINRCLDDMYKTIVSQMAAPSDQRRRGLRVQDQATLQLIMMQSVAVETVLIRLKADLGRQETLFPEVTASLTAIRFTREQIRALFRRTLDQPSQPRGIRQL